jgi:hypothetical protein
MGCETTRNVRPGGTLDGFEAANEAQAFEQLKAELTLAIAAPDFAYEPLDADRIMWRNAH